MIDPYVYEDCGVLKNKFGIKDKELLNVIETNLSCCAICELSRNPLGGDYDFKHYCDFHAYILGDVYTWAGKIRTVPIEKEEETLGYMSIEYSEPEDIEKSLTDILSNMKNRKWESMSLDERATNLSFDMANLWKVHAFREGNTRTTVTFICQFADSRNMYMNRKLFEKNSAYTRRALVAASAIFSDVDLRRPEFLYKIVKDSLKQGEEHKLQKEESLGMEELKSQIQSMKNKNPESENKEKVESRIHIKER